MIATLRMLSRCCITPLYHVDVRCPRCGGQSVRRSSRIGAFERLISIVYVYPFRCPRCTHVRFTVQLGAAGRAVEIAEAVVRATHEGRVSLQFIHVGVDEQRQLAEYINAVALPISGGRPRRRRSLPVEVVVVAVAGLLVIFLILSMVTHIGAPAR